MKHSTSLHLLTTAAAVFFMVGCSPNSTVPTDSARSADSKVSAAEQSTELSVSYDAPADWAESSANDVTIFTTPEKDAVVAIVSIAKADNAEAAATAAWSRYDTDFSRTIRLNTARAAEKGWAEARTIEYETSPSEEHIANAYVRQARGQWKVILLDGKTGTVVKRQAAAFGLLDSFAVEGYVAEDLSDRTAHELTPERVKKLTDFIAASAKSLDVPGVGIALIQNGKVVFEGGIGVKAFGSETPIDKDTRFMIASNTKGMTTLLLAKLVEMDKLDWDDRVTDHYSSFKLGDQKTTESVLIKHLICACTGLPRKDLDWVFNSGPNAPASSTFDLLAATAPTSGFGELFQYNNQMAAAAGYIAGHILYPDMEIGAAYDKAMQEHIFDPLGMDQTTFSIQEAIQGNYAKPHAVNVKDEIKIIEQSADRGFNHTVVPFRPAGAAWSTPHDMIKYIQNELSEGVAADGTRLFAAASLLKRREPFVSTGKDSFYGMGLSTQTLSGIKIVEHGGSMAGYKSQMAIIPGAKTGAVILTNSDSGGRLLGPFTQRLVEILYDAESKAEEQVKVAAKFGQSNREKFRADFEIPPKPEIVSELAPYYYSDELGPLDVRTEGDDIILDPGVWSTPIATKKNADETISLVMTNPALLGFEIVVGKEDGKRTLTLIDAQHSYVFTEAAK